MSALLQDVRYALRTLRKSPGFAAVAVLTLALGIGANAAIFALVDRVLIRPLPVRNPGSLVLLRSPGPIQGHVWSDGDMATSFSAPMYRDLRERAGVFDGLLGEYPFAASVAAGGETELASGELVSGNYFDVLGVPPAIGRNLTPDDDRVPGAHAVVVLSHGYWSRRFGGDPSVVGRTISVNGRELSVVGVARRGFSGIQPGRPADLFVPLMMKAPMTPFWDGLEDPKDHWLQIVGRLKPGLSRARAEAAILPLYRSLLAGVLPRITSWDDARRRQFLDKRILLVPGARGRTVLRDGVGTPLVSLMGMVALVLLIACSNLAGLLAARGAARQKEYGIRLAIGASRAQLLRQSVVECLLFALSGGALGLVVAAWTLQALTSVFPADADLRQVAAQIDPRVMAFAAIVSLAAGVLFGVSPALRAARLDPARTLSGQGRGASSAGPDALRFRQWLVSAQIALTLVLLVASGLFVRSLANLGRVELGFLPDHVVGFTLSPELDGYPADRTAALARDLTQRLRAIPGVRAASAAELGTLTGDTEGSNVRAEGADPAAGNEDHVRRNQVGPDYFATLGIPLVAGREFTWRDDASASKVAVVNEAFVRRFFPGRSAVGRHLTFTASKPPAPIEIVGVVRDSKSATVAEKSEPFVYAPYLQDPKLGELTFYVRAAQAPETLSSAIREQVRQLDPKLPVYGIKTLSRQLDDSLASDRLIVILSACFGGLATILAAIGIYGVLAFAVGQRRREIGVRMALGADPASVRRLVLGEVGRFLVVGGAIGLPAACVLARLVESILFGVRATDPLVYAGGTALMAAVAALAGSLPARRAARIDPLEALRSE
jgi:putative ABC transport system permease protein